MKYFIFLSILCANVFASPSVLHYDGDKQTYKYDKDIDKVRPIASVTKLMTAMVSLNSMANLDQQLMLSKRSRLVKSSLPKQKYKRIDLLNAMLVKSDNGAAETLAENFPGGRDAFIKEMNFVAKSLSMHNTSFSDPTGLSNQNLSTAVDVSKMVSAAGGYGLIRQISVKKQTQIDTRYKKKIRKIVLPNTNRLILVEFDEVIVSKTGFTNPAGYCVALLVQKKNKNDVIVILGASNKKERIKKVEEIMFNDITDESN